jgi:hypothetical protein
MVNKIVKYFGIISLFLLIASCSSKNKDSRVSVNDLLISNEDNQNEEYDVSLVKLIANPEKYNGKTIQIIGYLNLEFEGNAVYLHKEDYEHGLTRNGFWVDFSGPIKENKKLAFSKKYVIIVGKFDMKRHGHMSLFGGTIKDISRLDAW